MTTINSTVGEGTRVNWGASPTTSISLSQLNYAREAMSSNGISNPIFMDTTPLQREDLLEMQRRREVELNEARVRDELERRWRSIDVSAMTPSRGIGLRPLDLDIDSSIVRGTVTQDVDKDYYVAKVFIDKELAWEGTFNSKREANAAVTIEAREIRKILSE